MPVIGDDGVFGHGLVQFCHFLGCLIHGLFGEYLMRHAGVDESIDLRRGIFLAIDPFVHLIAEPSLHHVGEFDIEVVAFDHTL